MDKKGIIAISLSILVMVVWQIKFAPKPLPPAAQQATSAASPVQSESAPPAITSQTVPSPTPAAEAQPAVAEATQEVTAPSVAYTFTNLGGGIARVELLKHKAERGENVVLNRHGSTPIGAISETPGQGTTAANTVSVRSDLGEVVCEQQLPQQVLISKKFTLPKSADGTGEFLVGLEASFTNRGAEPARLGNWYLHTGSASAIHKNDLPTYLSFNWYAPGKLSSRNVTWFGEGRFPILGFQTSAEKPSYAEQRDELSWAGVRNQYFTTIITSPEAAGSGVWTRRFPMHPDAASGLNTKAGDPLAFAIEGALQMPGMTLAAGEVKTAHFQIWSGPKEYDRLKRLGHQEDEIMEFGMFKLVSEFLLTSMNWLHSVFENFGGYAVAIIILTLCIRSAMWPLVNKSTQSMKKMQAVQPKMNELKEKYKDDPTRMNQELMKLYKDYGINPLGGCLPMLLQIPIFFGFYAMLGTAIELRNSQFLWVHDLSQPDTIFHVAGFPVNILPLLMAATMLWQMSLTPKTGDPVQQRIFMFVPLIFIVFCYNYASALALYWTVQNLFSIGQLYLTRNQTAPVLQKAAAPKRRK